MNKHSFFKRVAELKIVLLHSNKEKLVGLSTSAHVANQGISISPVREGFDYVYINFIFSGPELLDEIIAEFDGIADYFLLDCEAKSKKFRDLELVAKSKIRNSKWFLVKPNDYTVDSIDCFLTCLNISLLGKVISIIGVGNLGGKLAIKLAERGALVKLWRRDPVKLAHACQAIRFFAPESGNILMAPVLEDALKESDVIVVCTPGIPVITAENISLIKRDSIIIDAGIGTIHKKAIASAEQHKIQIYCSSAGTGFDGLQSTWRATRQQLSGSGRRNIGSETSIITSGLMGRYGDILVTTLEPNRDILGVCDGSGGLLSSSDAGVFLRRYKQDVKK